MQTSNTAAPSATPAAKAPSGRDMFVADMAALRSATPPPAAQAGPPADPLPAAPPGEDNIPVDPIALADGEADADAETDPAVVEAAPPAKEEPLDPAAKKRMEASQKEERQRKEREATARAAIKAERDARMAEVEERARSVDAQAAKVKEYEAAVARAARDPLALLRAHGIEGDALETVARVAYAHSPAGMKNPANAAAAAQTMKGREVDDGLAAMRKELADLKAERAAEKEAATTERAVGSYLDAAMEVAKTGKVTTDDGEGNEIVAATVEAPIFKRWLASDGAAARQHLHAVAAELYKRDGEPPEPADLIAEVEKRERAALRKRGIDPATIGAAPAAVTPKKPAPPPPGKTLARAGASPAPTKKKMTEEEIREEFIRGRASGKFDD